MPVTHQELSGRSGAEPDVQRGSNSRTEVDVALSEGALMRLMGWTDRSMLDLYGKDLQVEPAFEARCRRGNVY
ncbi:hypothetical protein GCM10018966_073230 [Streptomyces yanii]